MALGNPSRSLEQVNILPQGFKMIKKEPKVNIIVNPEHNEHNSDPT